MPAIIGEIRKGSTDESITLEILDDTSFLQETGVVYNTASLALWYRRDGAAKTSITPVTLASLTTAHTDGGFLHISDGSYRVDVPDAAFATGVEKVVFGGSVPNMIIHSGTVNLIDEVAAVDVIPHLEINLTSTAGTAANLRIRS